VVAAATLALMVGCGGSQPEPETDMSDVEDTSMDTADMPQEVTPPERDEQTTYVDPNVEYRSVLQPIHFEFNKYRITSEAKPKLEEIAGLLKDNADWKILIEGHCDERGTNEYNLGLGEQRALSTKRYLVSLGVAESRFQTISYGEERPLDPRSNEEAWAKNRRAEFRVEAPRP
jgi:peptidoglycan-associated lipoprotein